MSDALEYHKGSVSIESRMFINFRFADDIVVNAEEEEAADDIITSMDTICTRYKKEIGPGKTIIMTNNPTKFKDRSKYKARRGEDIRITCPCNEHPLTPHFYIEKVRFTRVYIFFLFLLQNIDCGYSF